MAMIDGLPLWCRPLPEEPAHGLAQRLASVNGLPAAGFAYRQLGLTPMDLRQGRKLAELAAAVRCTPEAVARNSFHLDADGITIRVRGVDLNFKHDVDQFRRRACPACLRESAHHRFWWDVSAVSSCPRHGLLLEGSCNCALGGPLSWRDALVWRCQVCRPLPADEKGDLRNLQGTPVEEEIRALDAYLLGRLGVIPKRQVVALDRFDFHELQGVLERVGALHHGGWSKTWKDADDIEGKNLAMVRATGFRLLAEGGLEASLDRAYKQFMPPDGVEPNLTTAYGWFYHWYNGKGGARFSPEITEAIYSHASTRFRIDRKAMLDKRVVVSETTMKQIDAFDGQYVILSEAARICGQHLIKVRRLAVAYGLMREEKLTGRIVKLLAADVDLMKVLLERIVDRLDIGTILGVDTRAMTKFGSMGLLKPVLNGEEDGCRRYAYLIDDVDELLATFEATAIERSERPDDELVRVLSRRVRPKLAGIVDAVREGTLSPVRIGDQSAVGLRAFAVALQDVQHIATSDSAAVPKPDFDHWRRRIAALT